MNSISCYIVKLTQTREKFIAKYAKGNPILIIFLTDTSTLRQVEKLAPELRHHGPPWSQWGQELLTISYL